MVTITDDRPLSIEECSNLCDRVNRRMKDDKLPMPVRMAAVDVQVGVLRLEVALREYHMGRFD